MRIHLYTAGTLRDARNDDLGGVRRGGAGKGARVLTASSTKSRLPRPYLSVWDAAAGQRYDSSS